MTTYIVCKKLKGWPRKPIDYCIERCPDREDCETFTELPNPVLPEKLKRSIEPKD